MSPPRYPSDLSDEEWPTPRTVAVVHRKTRPSAEVVAEARGERRILPAKEWPLVEDGASRVSYGRQTVYYHFRKWRLDGRLRQAHDRLRTAVRGAEGRDRDPSAAVIDSQVVKTTPVGDIPGRAYDGAKGLSGRKRHILVDTNGLVLAARVHGANLPDRDGGRRLLDEEPGLPKLELVWADGAYTGGFREWLKEARGWPIVVHPVTECASLLCAARGVVFGIEVEDGLLSFEVLGGEHTLVFGEEVPVR